MKKYFISLILIFTCSVSVAQDYRGTPILGTTPIERTIDNSQNKSANLEQELANQIIPAAKIAGTPTGNSAEVGVTEGQLSVSLSGAANYSIPIAVPLGINGVVPQISLAYSSQAGNGMAGYGWNISGISAITRIPSTMFHDGVIDPVDFDGLDRFAFDGQRLLLKNPTQTYGAAGTVYETENFSNIKITAVGGTNNNPASFTVEYPDGSIGTYGVNNNSKTVSTWGISFWQNAQGVRINYSYFTDENFLYLAIISYGNINNNSPLNIIQFSYVTRARPEQNYIGGQDVRINNILIDVKVISAGTGFRNYYLGYDENSLRYNRLVKITEKSGDNTKEYNPTIFSYDTTTNPTTFETYPVSTVPVWSGLNNQNSTVVNGDFDADGKSDMIIYETTGSAARNQYTLVTNLTGNNVNNVNHNNTVGNFEDIFAVTYTNFSNILFPNQGWCVVKKNVSSYSTDYSFQTHNSWIGVSAPPPLNYQIPRTVNFSNIVVDIANPNLNCTNNTQYINQEKQFLSGDFNGDGITDVLAVEKPFYFETWIDQNFPGGCQSCCYRYPSSRQGGKTYFIDLKTSTTNYFFESGNIGFIDNNTKIQVVDFNGDGKSDLMVLREGNVKYYTLDQNNQLVLLFDLNEAGFKINHPLLIGDYNGDGKTDFCIPLAVNLDSWNFYFSTGTSLAGKNGSIGQPYLPWICGVGYDFNEFYYFSSDFNNDGKTDIVAMQNKTTPRYGAGNAYCDPNFNATQPIWMRLNLMENKIVNYNQIVFAPNLGPNINIPIKRYPIIAMLDHNNPRNKSEFSIIQDNKIVTFKQPKDSAKDMLLRKITTGNGVEETITYKPLKEENVNGTNYDNPNLYFSNGNLLERYPNMDIIAAPSFKVVSKLEKQSTSVSKKQFFTYAGAVSNVEGLGFFGFRGTMRTNWHDGVAPNYLISNVSMNDISLRGANITSFSGVNLWRADAALPSSGFISKSKYVYNKHFKLESFTIPLLPNKVFKLYLTDSEQFNGLENTKSTTKTRYDVYNNPSISTTNLFNGVSYEQTNVSSITYQNNTATSTYIVGRPLTKNTSTIIYPTIAANRDETKSEEIYTFNNNLLSEVKKRSTNSGQISNFLTEQNDYDNFGNITQKRILATGLATRTTNYEYNPAYPFNGRFLTKSIDIEGLATEFTYNPANGLLISEKNPYNLTTSYEYDKWFKKTKVTDYLGKSKIFEYSRISSTETLIQVKGDDLSFSGEIFDDLGRKKFSGVKDISGNYSNTFYEYDIHDRNFKSSEPYFSTSSPTQFNTTTYDGYGRPIRSDSFTGKFVTIAYNGLTTTVSENVTLPTPLVVKSKATTKNAIGNVIAMTETLGGVPGGTINYTYFANGNLKTTVFGGATTTITQDAWGRKKQLDDPSAGTYQYTYNDFGETLTETVRAVAAGNIKGITTYTIDGVGKVSEKTIVGQNGDLTNSKTTYTYDTTDKLLKTMRFDDYTAGNFTNYTYGYDAFKRPNFNDESGFQAYYQRAQQYDAFGRVERELYTAINTSDLKRSDKWIRYNYKNGYQHQIIDDGTNKILREIKSVNARGQLTQALNGFTTEGHQYNAFGLQTNVNYMNLAGPNNSVSGTSFLSLNTNFDNQRGNLLSRSNPFTTYQENFTYDTQDRLLTYPNETVVIQTQSYDVAGKITANNIGDYAYTNTSKPYQLTSITPVDQSAGSAVLNYYTNRTQDIKYNVFKSPVSIIEQDKENIFFEYNTFNQRSTMYYGGLQTDKNLLPMRKFYNADGTMEIKRTLSGGVEFTTYIGGDAYSAPLMLKSNGTTQNYLYLCRDYQGSIIAVTDVDGLLLNKRFYDAWGKLSHNENRVCPVASCPMQASMPTTANGLVYTDRGYTGHEMLLGVGLINMNARLYDPKLHRFLAPDNFVQDPSNTQSFNRYTYCLNNPLKWQDYSGEDWWSDNWKTVAVVVTTVAVAALVVATAGAATPLLVVAIQAGTVAGFVGGGLGTALNGGSFGDVVGGSIKGAFLGAAGGAIGFAAGLAAPAGIIGGGLYGALSGVAVNGILNAFQGRPIFEGAGLSAILGGVGGATGGYARAKADGKNVWTGTAKPSVIADNVNESIGQAQVAYDKSVASQAEPTSMSNSSSQVTNSKGALYPDVSVEGYGKVPFPSEPLTPNNSQALRPKFTPKLKMEFKDYWIEKHGSWPVVPDGSALNIHHIQPLKYGGTNSFNNLVPLIQPAQHQPFTSWWAGFNQNP